MAEISRGGVPGFRLRHRAGVLAPCGSGCTRRALQAHPLESLSFDGDPSISSNNPMGNTMSFTAVSDFTLVEAE